MGGVERCLGSAAIRNHGINHEPLRLQEKGSLCVNKANEQQFIYSVVRITAKNTR